jgi:hypothetical protein
LKRGGRSDSSWSACKVDTECILMLCLKYLFHVNYFWTIPQHFSLIRLNNFNL